MYLLLYLKYIFYLFLRQWAREWKCQCQSGPTGWGTPLFQMPRADLLRRTNRRRCLEFGENGVEFEGKRPGGEPMLPAGWGERTGPCGRCLGVWLEWLEECDEIRVWEVLNLGTRRATKICFSALLVLGPRRFTYMTRLVFIIYYRGGDWLCSIEHSADLHSGCKDCCPFSITGFVLQKYLEAIKTKCSRREVTLSGNKI